jgi:hypothetical protein
VKGKDVQCIIEAAFPPTGIIFFIVFKKVMFNLRVFNSCAHFQECNYRISREMAALCSYEIFSSFLSIPPFYIQVFLLAPCSQTPSVMSFSLLVYQRSHMVYCASECDQEQCLLSSICTNQMLQKLQMNRFV